MRKITVLPEIYTHEYVLEHHLNIKTHSPEQNLVERKTLLPGCHINQIYWKGDSTFFPPVFSIFSRELAEMQDNLFLWTLV